MGVILSVVAPGYPLTYTVDVTDRKDTGRVDREVGPRNLVVRVFSLFLVKGYIRCQPLADRTVSGHAVNYIKWLIRYEK